MSFIKKAPTLRFSEFSGDWEEKKLSDIFERISLPVEVDETKLYQQIGIRSHGKGIFHKDYVTGASLGNKRVFWIKENVFIVNIVFAWEQAVAKTTMKEIGMIASHRFPMYQPIYDKLSLDYILYLFLTKKGKGLLEMASPGGAGRNKTLGQKEFERLRIIIPSLPEQQKIASFLTAVDDNIQQLTKKKALLEQYKKGVMQQLFSQQIRFKDENGNDFPKWKEKTLGELCNIVKGEQLNKSELREIGKYPALNGGIDPSGYTDEWNTIEDTITISEGGNSCGYVNYMKTKFWSGGHCYSLSNLVEGLKKPFLYQILKFNQNEIMRLRVGSGLPNIQKKDINCLKLLIPSPDEQEKIANFLSAIDDKIKLVTIQLEKKQTFKKGLLQQMFV
ncbi:restriction endonuclease subunit S [Solitalea lacus]|uniref:restriction endonuclease subunit S n=1 Tax=Solitalea lacus TaxID=2911172 RepID=UPI001EDC2283|nr:restriction endonuclease subunit S [Solitalea lacus]UKJ07927.1 restriction endonuclease subunit S [Solitalea lacus]